MDLISPRPWHALLATEAIALLGTDPQVGLTSAEAKRRLALVGPNIITGQAGPSAFERLLGQVRHPLIYILVVAGAITALLPGHGVDAVVIFGVVAANVAVGYVQETSAQAAISALSRLVAVRATVVREGQPTRVDAADLVPGDLVRLEAGDGVPADLRLLQVRELHADESSLTGESVPVAKEVGPLPENTQPADRRNMAYSGTTITAGRGTGLVVSTGESTEIGRISHLIATATKVETPLTRRLARFSVGLSWVITGVADRLRAAASALDSIPFASERGYMATLHDLPAEGRVIYAKGSAERVLALAERTVGPDGEEEPLDPERARTLVDELAARGLRVLAFARKQATQEEVLHPEQLARGLVYLGLQAMLDPPRPEAVRAVATARQAGIAVKMVTGDHALTARAIAAEMGLGDGQVETWTGRDLAAVSDDALPAIVERAQVFARVTPEQKLRLVRALQARDRVVAMTGDGVNDAPALKQADIGIAMGVTGTEVAKQAAEMVLTDDNFASIEAAVEEGRAVYDNLRKFITWTLPTNGGEALLVLTAIALGLTMPILPVQILWVNLTTSVVLGIPLAFEPKEPDLMLRPPRDPAEPILTPDLVLRTGYVSVLILLAAYGLFFLDLSTRGRLAEARTIATNTVVLAEIGYLFSSRSLCGATGLVGIAANPWAALGVLAMVALQVAFTYTPLLQTLFQTAPIPSLSWLAVVGVATLVYAVVELEKWWRRRLAACPLW